MDFTNFFFGNTKEPTPDAIGNSLRFRNNGTSTIYLHNADLNFLGDQTYTLSYWLKKGCGNDWSLMNIDVFNNDTSASGTPGAGVHHTASGGLSMYSGSGFARGYPGSPNFRDLNGWYHFCHARNATGWQTWVNGINLGIVEISDLDGAGGTKIMNPWGGGQTQASATIAEYHCVDGQYMGPENFGMFDENNVWIPIKVDFAAGTTSEMYSSYLTASNGDFITSPKLAFNGDVDESTSGSGRCYTDIGADITWAPVTPVPFTTSLEIFNTNQPSQQEIIWDGNTVNPTGGWVTVYSGSGEVSQEKPLYINSIGAQRAELHAVRIDGQLVNDPYLWSSQVSLLGQGSEGGFASQPYLMFDGNLNTTCDAAAANQSIAWQLSAPLTYNEKIEVYTPGPADTQIIYLYLDGAEVVPGINNLSGAWTTVIEGSGTFDDLRIYGQSGQYARWSAVRIDGNIYVDGANPSYGPNGWYLKFDDLENPGKDSSGNGNDFTGTGFDNDSTQTSFDWLDDSPQNNYATYAPNYGYGAQAEFTDANLTTRSSSGVQYSYASYILQPEDVGTYYFEFTPTSIVNGIYPTLYFVQDPSQSMTDAPNLYFYLHADGTLITRMATLVSGAAPSFANFDTVGVLVNLQNDSVEIKVNGADGVVMQLDNREYLNMALSANTNGMGSVNFGQQPFKYPPTEDVSGFVSDNLPEPAIIDGSQHHQTITGPGEGGYGLYYHLTETDYNLGIENMTFLGVIPGNSVNAQQFVCDCFDLVDTTTFTISSGWGWLGGNAQVYVSVDGSENSWIQTSNDQTMGNNETVTVSHSSPFRYFKLNYKIVGQVNFGDITTANSPLLERARALFPNGFYWIKDRENGSTQHQLLDTINGDSAWRLPNPTAPQTYVPPTGDSAAWCWSAPDSWTDASIDTGYRNVKAGFSMFTYTGDGANTRDIAHGLGKAPDCVIIFNPESNDVNTYIRGLEGTGSSTNNLVFSTTEQAGNIFGAGIIYAPDSPSTITVGLSQDPANVNGVNKDGVTYRCYCWTTVPGYSQFGTYTGNGVSPKGTYTHMDFQPSFMLTKPVTNGDWRIYDTTRSPWNPVNSCLKNATTQAEETGGQEMDWLSTGVRNRDNGSPNNGAGTVYAYMAFAKHPTKYSNAR